MRQKDRQHSSEFDITRVDTDWSTFTCRDIIVSPTFVREVLEYYMSVSSSTGIRIPVVAVGISALQSSNLEIVPLPDDVVNGGSPTFEYSFISSGNIWL